MKALKSPVLYFLSLSLFLILETVNAQDLFFDDFEKDLSNWELNNPEKLRIIPSGDATHGQVLELHPGGPNTFALIKGSDNWTNIRIEGDVLFPEYDHNYLGVIYNHNIRGTRADYGCIYIKGNGSYVRVNPHRDAHVSRVLYNEYWSKLTGSDTIITGKWQHFKMEVMGPVCHFYVGDMTTPKITFDHHEYSSGKVGFEPRVIGSEVWIDNIKVERIQSFSYKGRMLPSGIQYEPSLLLTNWQAIGPFRYPIEGIEKDGFQPAKSYEAHRQQYEWQPFEADGRGCIIGGKIIEWTSLKTHVYFHTSIRTTAAQAAQLHLSSSNKLKIWLNGQLIEEVDGKGHAWYDFWKNPAHKGNTVDLNLKFGENSLMILEYGLGWKGGYRGDGFYAKLDIN